MAIFHIFINTTDRCRRRLSPLLILAIVPNGFHVFALGRRERYFPTEVAPCALIPPFEGFGFRRAVRSEDAALVGVTAFVEWLDRQLAVLVVVIQHRSGAAERTRKRHNKPWLTNRQFRFNFTHGHSFRRRWQHILRSQHRESRTFRSGPRLRIGIFAKRSFPLFLRV